MVVRPSVRPSTQDPSEERNFWKKGFFLLFFAIIIC